LSSSVDTKVKSRPKVAGERSRARTAPLPRDPQTVAPATEPAERPSSLRRRLRLPSLPTRHTSTSGEPTVSGRRQWVAALVALVAVLAVLGAVVGVSLRDSAAQAGTDRAAASQARTSIEQMLSYNYKTIDAQAAQIEGLLTGSFKGEFTAAMDKDIKPLAVKNQTVVQAKVSDIGVMSSSPTTVKVLAFVNQARIGTDQKDPVVDQNRVIATMSKVGDRWLISKVEAF
jgi:Mce-associated membrane protein